MGGRSLIFTISLRLWPFCRILSWTTSWSLRRVLSLLTLLLWFKHLIFLFLLISSFFLCSLVGTPLCMLAHFLFFNTCNVVSIRQLLLLNSLFQRILRWSISRSFLKISETPITFWTLRTLWIAWFLLSHFGLLFLINSLDLLFHGALLSLSYIFIVLLVIRIKFSWTFVIIATHLWPKNLGKSSTATTASVCEDTFWFFFFLTFACLSHSVYVRFLVCARWRWLPCRVIKLFELMASFHLLISTSWEQVDLIINLNALIKHCSHDILTIRWPVDSYSTISFCTTNIFEFVKSPQIEVALQVPEPTD